MRFVNRQGDVDEDERWWRLDLTTVLVLVVVVVAVLFLSSELWHSHYGIH